MITELLKSPAKPDGVTAAVEHQKRVRLHSEPEVRAVHGVRKSQSKGYHASSDAFTSLLDWMRRILPRDKFRVAMNLVRHPLDSVSLIGEAYQQLERAFDGVDRTEEYKFSGDKTLADWLEFRKQLLGNADGWRTKGMQYLRGSHNGIAVVDLAETPNGTDTRPSPYFYVLDIDKAHSFKIAPNGSQLEYLIYFDEKTNGVDAGRIAYVFDDTHYRVISINSSGGYTTLTENVHGIGYCPASMFWGETIDHDCSALRSHPITDYLANLDWYQLSAWFDRYGDLFNGWPITTTYQQQCNYNSESEYCDNGYLRSTIAERGNSGVYLMDGDDLAICPACKDRNSIGPGTNYEVPLPNAANGNTVMLPAVGITTADVSALKYQSDKLEKQSVKIFSGIVGSVFEAVSNQAINEKQVDSLFEARKKVVIKLARNFERFQSWAEETMCLLRYGTDFKYLSINYGTKFFMFSESELMEMYLAARDAGLNAGLLDELQSMYFETRHRRQPKQLERIKMLLAIDPARHVSSDNLIVLRDAGMLSPTDLALKLNISTLISRFEREKGAITSFQETKTMAVRIDAIKAVLLSYLPEPESEMDDESKDDDEQIDNENNQD